MRPLSSRNLIAGRRAHRDQREVSSNLRYSQVAFTLRANGYSPIPLTAKMPKGLAAWQHSFCERAPTEFEIERWSAECIGKRTFDGVGVANYDGLFIIDIDDSAFFDVAMQLVPAAATAPACAGRRGRKIFMRSEDRSNRQEWNIGGGPVELLSWHHQGVIPPTIHPETGAAYRWLDESRTLLSTPLRELPLITIAQIEALLAEFRQATKVSSPKPKTDRKAKTAPADMPPNPPNGWIEVSPNRAKIEELIGKFKTVHQAAREAGGRIVIGGTGSWNGPSKSGAANRDEIIDIDATGHWRNCCRIIVDVLGDTTEAYWLHVEVSRGNATLGLPGGPKTYDRTDNWQFFRDVVDGLAFSKRKGHDARTIRSLDWWVRCVQGVQSFAPRERKMSNVKATYTAASALVRAGVAPNVEIARQKIRQQFSRKSKRGGLSSAHQLLMAIVNSISAEHGYTSDSDRKKIAARFGVTDRTVSNILKKAADLGIIIKARANEGGRVSKHASAYLVTVPVAVVSPAANYARSENEFAQDDWSDDRTDEEIEALRAEVEAAQNPYGRLHYTEVPEAIAAFEAFRAMARDGKAIIEPLLASGVLPQEPGTLLSAIAVQDAGNKTLRIIAGEIGEMLVRNPERWDFEVQDALRRTAFVVGVEEQKKGRKITARAWARKFAERLGKVNFEAGRMTYMGRNSAIVAGKRMAAA